MIKDSIPKKFAATAVHFTAPAVQSTVVVEPAEAYKVIYTARPDDVIKDGSEMQRRGKAALARFRAGKSRVIG